jgi:pimeloyl-ACP methyl ester carboxylesterase
VLTRTTYDLPRGRFHALVGGSGRTIVFLHGFPDHPPTAVPLLTELCRRGFRVVAPWLRGYAPSPLEGPYDVPSLVADVRALIGDDEVDVVGHDWGAAITYLLCREVPGTRVRRAVTLALPDLIPFLRQLRRPRQLLHSWYMAAAQLDVIGLRTIDLLWRRWSPGFQLDDARRGELHACLAQSLPAPLEYYRAFRRKLTDRAFIASLKRPLTTPLLALHGADDGCVLPPRGSEILANLGHFLHLEAPAAIADRIAAWLA